VPYNVRSLPLSEGPVARPPKQLFRKGRIAARPPHHDTGPMTTNSSTAVIRQWARDQGMAVGDRGRLSPEVLDAYRTQSDDAAVVAKPPADAVNTPPRSKSGAFRIKTRPSRGATGTNRRVNARSS
jgi:hypothetical protein